MRKIFPTVFIFWLSGNFYYIQENKLMGIFGFVVFGVMIIDLIDDLIKFIKKKCRQKYKKYDIIKK